MSVDAECVYAHASDNAAQFRAATTLLETEPEAVTRITKFVGLLPADTPNESTAYEAGRLRYFAMARVLTDRMVPFIDAATEASPPYGLREWYRREGMDGPERRNITDFSIDRPEEEGVYAERRDSIWGVLRNGYWSKMYDVVAGSLERDQELIPDIVHAMANEKMPTYHINTKSDPEEAFDRLWQQAVNAIDTVVGIARVIPAVAAMNPDKSIDMYEALNGSKPLAHAISYLAFSQLQHLLLELTGGKPLPGREGWDFLPEYFEISTPVDAPARLTFKSGLEQMDVPIFDHKNRGTDEYVPDISIIGDQRLIDVAPRSTTYGCPAFKLISAMCDDVAKIVQEAKLYG